jgi:DNA-binding NarL/FixJ family response regulator
MRILIADNQSNVRFALRTLLEQQPEVQIVAEASNGDALGKYMAISCPDLVLLDWNLPGLPARTRLSALFRACPETVVLVLSGRPEQRGAALAAGADFFVSKADPPEKLMAAIWSATRAERRGCANPS